MILSVGKLLKKLKVQVMNFKIIARCQQMKNPGYKYSKDGRKVILHHGVDKQSRVYLWVGGWRFQNRILD
jgi:hypothetical protein